MNKNENVKIAELKEHIQDLLLSEFNDFDYLRWLEGYDFHVDKVVPKLRHHLRVLKVCQEMNYNEDHPVMKYWPYGLVGPTGKNDDNLVYIEMFGHLDTPGLLKSCHASLMLRIMLFKIQKTMTQIRQKEHETGRQWSVVHIMDIENLQSSENQLKMITGPFSAVLRFAQEHCVEFSRKIILVNVPSIIHIIYHSVRPFLPSKTKKKLIILGSDWKVELQKHIEPDCLPVHWGGTMTDPINNDNYCSSLVVVPPLKFDPKFFWHPKPSDPLKENLSRLTVHAWSKGSVTVYIGKPMSKLRWFFWTSGDYGFGVFYVGDDQVENDMSKMPMVYPQTIRVAGPTLVPEEDEILCQKSGFYKLEFNNSFSWFHSLEISYDIQITQP